MSTIQFYLASVVLVIGLHQEGLAQLTIGSSSTVAVKGDVSARGSVNNASSQTNLSEATLVLVGTNQTLSSSTPLVLRGLIVDGGGTKTTQGDWTITNDLVFSSGIVTIGSGRILYTGSEALSGSPASFVNGQFFQRGTGTRFFPIGVGNAYAPMAFGSVQQGNVDLGVRVFASNASLSLPLDVSAIASNRYWEVTASGGTFSGSGVSLFVPGSSIDAASKLIVVQSDAVGGDAVNLGGGITGNFVVSFQSAAKPILTLGIVETVELQIKDLITPFNNDDINDYLKIVNIEFTSENSVTLLDRWGVAVKSWKNFRNYDDPNNPNIDSFDFSRLSPGNYICVLEYRLTPDGPQQKLTQMISVLKGN
jgi:hypothetical protein